MRFAQIRCRSEATRHERILDITRGSSIRERRSSWPEFAEWNEFLVLFPRSNGHQELRYSCVLHPLTVSFRFFLFLFCII